MTTGLTLGKFAPLHPGHQLVIGTALAEMDHVIVVIYQATAVTSIPLHVRAGWIRELYPSKPYGEHVSRSLSCENRTVDLDRRQCPVSATGIRRDLFSYVDRLDRVVRADLLPRIALLGGPSTGKTTVAEAVATQFGEPFCREYGREYWLREEQKRPGGVRGDTAAVSSDRSSEDPS